MKPLELTFLQLFRAITEEPSMEEIIEKMSQSLNISNKEVKDTPPQCFVAYHVYVMEEKEAMKESQSDEYEMQLYQDYVEREGVQQGLPLFVVFFLLSSFLIRF